MWDSRTARKCTARHFTDLRLMSVFRHLMEASIRRNTLPIAYRFSPLSCVVPCIRRQSAASGPEQSADKPCAAELADITPKQDHLVAEIRWQCSPGDPVLVMAVRLFQEIDPAARHMVTASGDVRTFALLSASRTTVSLRAGDARLGEVLWRYFLAGIEHIAIGYDHIAFLIAVVLWGRRFWALAAVVTAFTLAHSVTLSLAVLDVVQIPPKLVEIMIALSIVYVAAENFFVRDIGRRWILTFCFGLIHGFGFASALREYGIPQDKVGWALSTSAWKPVSW